MPENEQQKPSGKKDDNAHEQKKDSEKKPEAATEKKTKIEEVKKDLLAQSEISIILDTYDDIFSDFDPRPYSQRGLSEDFVAEATKAAEVAKSGDLQLRFMIPKAQKNDGHEALIRKRIREYFKKQCEIFEKGREKVKRDGAMLACAGFAILMVATYILSLGENSLFFNFLIVILEPSGWFTAWSGLEMLVYKSKDKNSEIEFGRKMSKADVEFIEY